LVSIHAVAVGAKTALAFQTRDIPSQLLADDPLVVEINEKINSPPGPYNGEAGK
jgi:hypothetical protein